MLWAVARLLPSSSPIRLPTGGHSSRIRPAIGSYRRRSVLPVWLLIRVMWAGMLYRLIQHRLQRPGELSPPGHITQSRERSPEAIALICVTFDKGSPASPDDLLALPAAGPASLLAFPLPRSARSDLLLPYHSIVVELPYLPESCHCVAIRQRMFASPGSGKCKRDVHWVNINCRGSLLPVPAWVMQVWVALLLPALGSATASGSAAATIIFGRGQIEIGSQDCGT
jgi:hypothetical protein